MVKLYGEWFGREVTTTITPWDGVTVVDFRWAIHRVFPGAILIAYGPTK